ncbi:histidine phosphatase superfamily [Jimgerdemannia flammicorona]|uniref:Multiple inositol polyphosphate phosphatase 1 n=2 Tax=Jimgerdemannia flammicorona TaxID=994334 RepID=A0A433R0C6_9FUNG|nr:histidine phosphatase superfamily [Jimgerdemannia flammicorona]RUS35483.1 histidine phosphatase superfamily [Jimgerdemannia flammicorona]
MPSIVGTLLLLSLALQACHAAPEFHSNPFNILDHLGSKGPYPISNRISSPIVLHATCKLAQIHVLARHGTRYPSNKESKRFIDLYALFSDAKIDHQHRWLRTWVNQYDPLKSNLLALAGDKDLYFLGKRLAARYNSFFRNSTYNANIFEFRASDTSRSSQSGSAFSIGLFEGDGPLGYSRIQPIFLYTIPKGIDRQLAMKHACPKWLKEGRINPFRDAQIDAFASLHLPAIAQRLNAQFPNLDLQPEHISDIYSLCGYEASFKGSTSTWCTLLQPPEVEALEYIEDMDEYFSFSYGNPLNEFLACDLVTNLVTDIEALISNNPAAKHGTFKFGHAETIKFLATLLNISHDDQPLLANATAQFICNRKYRTSQIVPFAANMVFEVLNCSNAGYKIRMMINERPVAIPGCVGGESAKDAHACPWETFRKLVSSKVGCDFQKVCALSTVKPLVTSNDDVTRMSLDRQ